MTKEEIKQQLQEIKENSLGSQGSCSWIAFWDLVHLVEEIIEEKE